MTIHRSMETYYGHVRTAADAIVLFEACRLGVLPRVQRRLTEKERLNIRSGSVFVWDEREAGMRRWTDGKSWSASRVSGSFLTYREMEGKRAEDDEKDHHGQNGPNGEVESVINFGIDDNPAPEGYRYKPDGLLKQSFSLTTSSNLKLHLISYFSRLQSLSHELVVPTQDPKLQHIVIPKGLYPDASSPYDPSPNLAAHGHSNDHHMQRPLQGQHYPHPPSHIPPHPMIAPGPAQARQLPHTPPQFNRPSLGPTPGPDYYYHSPNQTPGQGPSPPSAQAQAQAQAQALGQPPHRHQHYRHHVHATSNTLLEPSPLNNGSGLQVQDIPYEKVAWSEDQRAIQVLDRGFLA